VYAPQNRESQVRDQVAALEQDVQRLQGELARTQADADAERDKARKVAAQAQAQAHAQAQAQAQKQHSPPRPDSRASTVFVSRAATPVQGKRTGTPMTQNGARSSTPPTSSIWDSMHAPKGVDPRQRYMAAAGLGNGVPRSSPRPGGYYGRPPIASPTPSVVSVAPTQGADGWWE
jgi:hypothetical protein